MKRLLSMFTITQSSKDCTLVYDYVTLLFVVAAADGCEDFTVSFHHIKPPAYNHLSDDVIIEGTMNWIGASYRYA